MNDCAREMMAQIRTGINNIQFVDLGVTPTETGNTTFTLAGNQMQWYPYGNRVQANVGGTLLYGTIISSSYTTNTGVTLRFDTGQAVTGQQLTNSLSAVATGFPSAVNHALPEMVFRRRNVIRNPCMDIWQRGPGPVSVSNVAQVYLADGWQFGMSATAGVALNISRFERSANASFVPTVAQTGLLITCAYGLSVNAAMATLNNGTYAVISQSIEGFTFRQLAQKPMTASFWVNSRQTGTYHLAVQNTAFNQSCVLPFSISSVATWEKKTIQIPKTPATGTWDYSYGAGIKVSICLASGAGGNGGAGNWTAANILCTSAQTNFLTSAGNVFMMTGFQLEEGNQATPLEPIDIQSELARNQRYLVVFNNTGPGGYNIGTGVVAAASIGSAVKVSLPQSMRASPAISSTGVTYIYDGAVQSLVLHYSTEQSVGAVGNSNNVWTGDISTNGALTVGRPANFAISVGGSVIFKSEL